MIPFDKSGRPIYGRTWAAITLYGERLTRAGYRESVKKPNLFWAVRPMQGGLTGSFYADMRGTEEVPIWTDPKPLFYLKASKDAPEWMMNRFRKSEMSRLRVHRVAVRLSFYAENCALPSDKAREDHRLRFSLKDDGEIPVRDWWGSIEDGYCRLCLSDFGDHGFLCGSCRGNLLAKRAGEEYVERLRRGDLELQGGRCIFCGKEIRKGTAMLDHSHETGRVRGYTCRACNALNTEWALIEKANQAP